MEDQEVHGSHGALTGIGGGADSHHARKEGLEQASHLHDLPGALASAMAEEEQQIAAAYCLFEIYCSLH